MSRNTTTFEAGLKMVCSNRPPTAHTQNVDLELNPPCETSTKFRNVSKTKMYLNQHMLVLTSSSYKNKCRTEETWTG